jgi:hypothetical protein
MSSNEFLKKRKPKIRTKDCVIKFCSLGEAATELTNCNPYLPR